MLDAYADALSPYLEVILLFPCASRARFCWILDPSPLAPLRHNDCRTQNAQNAQSGRCNGGTAVGLERTILPSRQRHAVAASALRSLRTLRPSCCIAEMPQNPGRSG